MRKVIKIAADDTAPPIGDVLKSQGIPDDVAPDRRILNLAEKAISVYRELSQPRGIIREISPAEFEIVYKGESENASKTPLGEIYPVSSDLCLFAVTIGAEICEEIARLFSMNEFAPAAMLNSAASEGAEIAARVVESHYHRYLNKNDRLDKSTGILRFSPGYCGWHISGQKKLFEFLRPEEIGLKLGESCLMDPLKSISGVIVAGPKEVFEFDPAFPFCEKCETFACRERIENISKY
jgi:hypothetical protein